MRLVYSVIGVLAVMVLGTQAHAQGLRLGHPAYGGSGCPAGSAAVALSPDQSAVSILFDEYLVEAGHAVGSAIGRKSCNIAVPVHVPQGYSISVFKVDYRGYTYVPSGAYARFNVEYFFAGQRGPSSTKTFRGFVDRNYTLTNNLAAESLVWSPCGADTNLRVNTNMMARSNRSGQDVLATVDSADISSGLVYHIQWRRCH